MITLKPLPGTKNSPICYPFGSSYQPFPTDGILSENMNLTKTEILANIETAGSLRGGYSYILSSVKFSPVHRGFRQHGSGPNFQGGYLTLCTCKRRMRAGLDLVSWRKKWIAGFTSRSILDHRHWLFYLSQVEEAHESFFDLWTNSCLPQQALELKRAHVDPLGDVFQPNRSNLKGLERFDPSNYVAPSLHSHRRNDCDKKWHQDIDTKYKRRHALLVGNPEKTFIWAKPMLYIESELSRDRQKWARIGDLLGQLREAE